MKRHNERLHLSARDLQRNLDLSFAAAGEPHDVRRREQYDG